MKLIKYYQSLTLILHIVLWVKKSPAKNVVISIARQKNVVISMALPVFHKNTLITQKETVDFSDL